MRVVLTIEMDTANEPSSYYSEESILKDVQKYCRKVLLLVGVISKLGTSNIQSNNTVVFHRNPIFIYKIEEDI